ERGGVGHLAHVAAPPLGRADPSLPAATHPFDRLLQALQRQPGPRLAIRAIVIVGHRPVLQPGLGLSLAHSGATGTARTQYLGQEGREAQAQGASGAGGNKGRFWLDTRCELAANARRALEVGAGWAGHSQRWTKRDAERSSG